MDKTTFDEYVKTRYISQMGYYNKVAAKNCTRYKWFQWLLIILSALTPVLAALNGITWFHEQKTYSIGSQPVQIALVIISSMVAILTTGLKTFRYQELWSNYRATYEQLLPEFYYYEFNIGEYGTPNIDKESKFVTRVEGILSNEHSQWTPIIKLEEQK